ncbi:MAG: glycosyltransferase family 2 protein [Candidatus Thermoplasmatota archaeon]|nr:glycosyltransferase family 2 protein [Candidatus Thermoplasmatota archaeon]
MGKTEVSIVIPVYNEEDNIKALHLRVSKEISRLTSRYEVLYIDDGSRDGTLKKLLNIADSDPRVTIVTFYRNFGKANALYTGFQHAGGDIVITMDGDLQDDPSEFKHFLDRLDEGYDLVTGWKYQRKDPLGKKIPSKLFNFLVRKMTGVNVHDSNCGFKAYRREVVQKIDVYGEFHRYLPMMASWRGFRVGEIKVKHHKRTHGRSKYGWERLFKGFMDLFSVSFLMKYGRSPLYLFGTLSGFFLALAVAGTVWTVVDALMDITSMEWVFGLVSLMLLFFSLTMFSFGLLSEMMLQTVGHQNMTKNHYRVIKAK